MEEEWGSGKLLSCTEGTKRECEFRERKEKAREERGSERAGARLGAWSPEETSSATPLPSTSLQPPSCFFSLPLLLLLLLAPRWCNNPAAPESRTKKKKKTAKKKTLLELLQALPERLQEKVGVALGPTHRRLHSKHVPPQPSFPDQDPFLLERFRYSGSSCCVGLLCFRVRNEVDSQHETGTADVSHDRVHFRFLDFLESFDEPVADREGNLLAPVVVDRGEDGTALIVLLVGGEKGEREETGGERGLKG